MNPSLVSHDVRLLTHRRLGPLVSLPTAQQEKMMTACNAGRHHQGAQGRQTQGVSQSGCLQAGAPAGSKATRAAGEDEELQAPTPAPKSLKGGRRKGSIHRAIA
ncbi:hypothetical protein ACPA9J_04645 [Pseudomonas aeruginosa]